MSCAFFISVEIGRVSCLASRYPSSQNQDIHRNGSLDPAFKQRLRHLPLCFQHLFHVADALHRQFFRLAYHQIPAAIRNRGERRQQRTVFPFQLEHPGLPGPYFLPQFGGGS